MLFEGFTNRKESVELSGSGIANFLEFCMKLIIIGFLIKLKESRRYILQAVGMDIFSKYSKPMSLISSFESSPHSSPALFK